MEGREKRKEGLYDCAGRNLLYAYCGKCWNELIIYFISMLAPLPSPGPLAPDNHFYDHFQRTLYTLDKGSLTAHQQTHNQSQPIPMSQSSTQPQSPLIPSLKVVSGKVVSNAQGNIIASRTD